MPSTLTLVTAFVCYFAAESLHLSGVIATVAGGLYAGRTLPRWASAEARVEAKALWNVALLAVNALVFTMIGLQLPTILEGLKGRSLSELCLWALVLTLAVIVIRFLWVFPATWLPVLVPGLANEIQCLRSERSLSSAGPGCEVSCRLPRLWHCQQHFRMEEPFAERPLIIFLAYAVILLTLIIPTLTLPPLLRFLKLQDGNERQDDEVRARIAMARTAADRLSQLRDTDLYGKTLLSDFDNRYQRHLNRLLPNLETNAYSALDRADQQRRDFYWS